MIIDTHKLFEVFLFCFLAACSVVGFAVMLCLWTGALVVGVPAP